MINQEQLNWLNNQFKDLKDQKFLIISHIPCGVDVFSSFNSMSKGGAPVPFWNPNPKEVEKPFLKIISNHFMAISGILVAHTHYDSFQILNRDLGLYTSYVPSVSPVHYNNPGFKIYTLDEANNLNNSISYYFEKAENTWKESYDFNKTDESNNLFLGMQSLAGSWLKNPTEIDEKYLKNMNLNADFSKLKNKWKYYICASNDNVDVIDFQDCISDMK